MRLYINYIYELKKLTKILMTLIIFIFILLILPHILPSYYIIFISYALSFAIASLGFNLLLGYTGLLSFGHAVFFAIGAYSVALIARYLPNIYYFEIVILIALISSALFAALIGIIALRVSEAYFAILMLAVSMIIYSLILKFYTITRGSDGLPVPIPKFIGLTIHGISQDVFIVKYYYYILISIFIVSLIIMYLIVSSPFGKALQAIRDNPNRAYLIGINVKLYKYYSFVISGTYVGLAGSLWSIVNMYTSPEVAHWSFSSDIVYMTLLGGYTIFLGPVLGAIIYTLIKLYTVIFTQYWLLASGIIILIISLLFPEGLGGAFLRAYKFLAPLTIKRERKEIREKNRRLR